MHKYKAQLNTSVGVTAGYPFVLVVPPNVVKQIPKRDDGTLRVLVHIEGLNPYTAKLLPDRNKGRYVIVNAERRETLEAAGLLESTLQIEVSPDTSAYGLPMPEDLRVALDEEPEASAHFEALSPAHQRRLIHRVSSAKLEETRATRAVEITTYLVEVQGKLNLKEFAAWVKQ